MTADLVQQWEQFEHNSTLHTLAAADLTLPCPPTSIEGWEFGAGSLVKGYNQTNQKTQQ